MIYKTLHRNLTIDPTKKPCISKLIYIINHWLLGFSNTHSNTLHV